MTTLYQYGGTSVSPLDFGWYATLFSHPIGGGSPLLCGGVVVSSRWVVTAAHCVEDAEAVSVYPAYQGDGWWPKAGAARAQTLLASPTYDVEYATNDLGLVKLDTALEYPVVATLDLNGSAWDALLDRAPLYSVGHGLSCTGSSECVTQDLHLTTLPKVARSRCLGNSTTTWPLDVVGQALCAGYTGIDFAPQPCQGDSGGPLFDDTFVYGLVSRGDASRGCGRSKRPTLFAGFGVNQDFLIGGVFAPPPPMVGGDTRSDEVMGSLLDGLGDQPPPQPTAPTLGGNTDESSQKGQSDQPPPSSVAPSPPAISPPPPPASSSATLPLVWRTALALAAAVAVLTA